MGKTLLRNHLIRRKSRHALPCKRFCSCCGEDSFKPSRLKSTKSLFKKQEALKRNTRSGKSLKGSNRVPIPVTSPKNSRKSVYNFLHGYTSNVRGLSKQVTVDIIRLNQNVLDVLSEKGCICLCNYSSESSCNLSPNSKYPKNSCLDAPIRRLRSTVVQPLVRQNVLDRLRELNSDWRSTSYYPLIGDLTVSSEVADNTQEPESTMKSLFLENLSICKKAAADEGTKENVKNSQNSNLARVMYDGQTNQQLKNTSISSQGNVHYTPYQTFTSISSSASTSLSRTTRSEDPSQGKCRSLLRSASERLALKSRIRQNFCSLLPPISDNRTRQPSKVMLGKKGTTVSSAPSTPLKSPPKPIEPQKPESTTKLSKIKSKQRNNSKIAATHKPSIEECTSKNDSSTSKMNYLQHITPQTSKPKPKILEIRSRPSVRNKAQGVVTSLIEKGFSQNFPSSTNSNPSAQVESQRSTRRKQSLKTLPMSSNICSLDKKSSDLGSKPVNRSLALKSISRTEESDHPGGEGVNQPYVDDSCSAPKKQKCNPKTSVSSDPTISFNPRSTLQENSSVPGRKEQETNDRFYTIVLSDSSEDECSAEKSAPEKPNAANRKSPKGKLVSQIVVKKQMKKLVFKPIPLKTMRNDYSKGLNDSVNQSKIPAAEKEVPKRRNSLRNSNSRGLSQKTKDAIKALQDSDSGSEGLSSDSEDYTPRYVSRTGRSVGVSSGCRSCPGCKIDAPRKEKAMKKPPRKRRKPVWKLLRSDDSISSRCEASMGFVPAGPKKPAEKSLRPPVAPPTVIIHGLVSSESSDEEIMGTSKSENGAWKSEGSQTIDAGLTSLGNSPTMSIPQLQRGDLEGVVNFTPKSSSCGQIAANSGPPETHNPSNDKEIDVNKFSELANQPISAAEFDNTSEVQSYSSQYGTAEKLLLQEMDCESPEGDIHNQNEKSEPQLNEQSSDSMNDLLMGDISAVSSDNSSAIENFDFNEYTECESTCSSLTSSMPDGSSQAIYGIPVEMQLQDSNSNSCNVSTSSLVDESQPEDHLTKIEAVSEALGLCQDVPQSPDLVLVNATEGENSCPITKNCSASESDKLNENSAPELPGKVLLNNEIDLCNETSTRLGDSSVYNPVPGHDNRMRDSNPSERSSVCNQDGLDEALNVPSDTSPLNESACVGKTLLNEAPGVILVTNDVSNHLTEPLVDSSLVLSPSGLSVQLPSQQDDIIEALAGVRGGSSVEDVASRNLVTETLYSSDENCTTLRDAMVVDSQQNHAKCNATTPEISNLLDSEGGACKPDKIVDNNPAEIVSAAQDSQTFHGNHKVLEILMLEGCPSCQGETKPEESSSPTHDESCQDSCTMKPSEYLDSYAHDQICPLSSFSSADSSECGADSKVQEGRFYRAISDLLINCLNNKVEVVKLVNREVIVKKVNINSAESAPEMDPVDREASVRTEDIASIVQELNLPISLNPRLTIKKLPFLPQKDTSFFHTNSASQDSEKSWLLNKKEGSPKCQQYPVNSCATSTTPTKSLYDRKGYPTPIKRMDPRVLSVIKYNDLEIYSDEPSLNDPPESDRVECISSKGIRLELNPEELADLENRLNDFQDKSIQRSAPEQTAGTPSEIDDLVFYSDEPPLNLASVKRLKFPTLLESSEDMEDLIIDNDAPSLNEPVQTNAVCDPRPNDSECMVISSDDEVDMNLVTGLDSPQVEVIPRSETVPNASCKPISKSRRKRFRKKRTSLDPVRAPSIIDLQRSQMKLRGGEPDGYVEGVNQQVWDLDELECSNSNEIIIDHNDVETSHLPSLKPLPPFQSCREVLYQPQVFNHQGQPILNLDAFGRFGGHIPATASSPQDSNSSSENVLPTSNVTFDLSETFQVPDQTECLNISDSDTRTASECDEVLMISPQKPHSTNLNGNALAKKTICDRKGVTVDTDTDSDDDVILMSEPDSVRSNRSLHFPVPVAPSVIQPYSGINRNLPAQLLSAQVESVCTESSNKFYVLVVPPNNPRSSNRLMYSQIPR